MAKRNRRKVGSLARNVRSTCGGRMLSQYDVGHQMFQRGERPRAGAHLHQIQGHNKAMLQHAAFMLSCMSDLAKRGKFYIFPPEHPCHWWKSEWPAVPCTAEADKDPVFKHQKERNKLMRAEPGTGNGLALVFSGKDTAHLIQQEGARYAH
jgi:hypothetical protein